MKLIVVGVNHKTAPVSLRERLAFGDDTDFALGALAKITDGAVILSTCNRSEIYALCLSVDCKDEKDADKDADKDATSCDAITAWLAHFKGIPLDDLLPFVYTYEGNRALTHWLRVAVGLDSMILGEPQILGQIKQAVRAAKDAGALSPRFGWLAQRIFAAARAVRRDTALGKQAVTLGFATAKLVTQIFDDPRKTTLLVVAAGEMNRLVAQNVAALGIRRAIVCNRSRERAEKLSEELLTAAKQSNRSLQVEIAALEQLPAALWQADVVSSCSGSAQTLITKAMAKTALRQRKNRAMLMVDLAVPRDIDPSVGELDGVFLYSIDDLQHVIEGNIKERKQAALDAEVLVGQWVSAIETRMHLQAVGKTIANYRAGAAAKKDELLFKAKRAVQAGGDPEAVLEEFARQLTNALTHPPSRLLRQSVGYLDENAIDRVGEDMLGAYRANRAKTF